MIMRRVVVVSVLVTWLLGSALVGGVLLIHHLVALPTPALADRALRDELWRRLPGHGWSAVHVMYRECGCSRRTIDHLLASPRPAGLYELVVMVDDHGNAAPIDTRLRAAGFEVVVVTPEILATRFHIEAAPVLVVVSPDGEPVYLGGYNRHKQSAAYEDIAIVAELRAHHAPSTLPVFGCAVSAQLERAVNPLRLGKDL